MTPREKIPSIHTELVTDRSASSECCGPATIKWGFMASIAARHHDRLYAINFTRPPDVAWDVSTPNEAPVAFWSRGTDGKWRSQLLDSPQRTYQTPSLLLGPDGRANVFTLGPGHDTMHWFRGTDTANTAFQRREISIAIGWGAYLGGAINNEGRALLVYWGTGYPYEKATIGYTLVDTNQDTSFNGTIDAPGAAYCYSQVTYARNGAHVLTVRDEVTDVLLAGDHNHYQDLRYYYSPDPASGAPWKWQHIMQNPQALIQPLGIQVDLDNRVHILYYYRLDLGSGNVTPDKLVYAVSRQPVSAQGEPQFVHHELKSSGDGRLFMKQDGRLFMTQDGGVLILAYTPGTASLEYAEVIDGSAGKLTPWVPVSLPVEQTRIFPISPQSGSTLAEASEGIYIGAPDTPAQRSMFYFRLPLHSD